MQTSHPLDHVSSDTLSSAPSTIILPFQMHRHGNSAPHAIVPTKKENQGCGSLLLAHRKRYLRGNTPTALTWLLLLPLPSARGTIRCPGSVKAHLHPLHPNHQVRVLVISHKAERHWGQIRAFPHQPRSHQQLRGPQIPPGSSTTVICPCRFIATKWLGGPLLCSWPT
jgi:hypothetical protein